MKKLILTISSLVILAGCFTTPSIAAEGWEATIKVKAGNATSRLSFGQQPDATSGIDGLYDVPALLSGTLQARFVSNETELWRDIRYHGEAGEWQLKIQSTIDNPITVSWDPYSFPEEITAELIDPAAANVIDMKSDSDYTLNEVNETELIIQVSNK